MFTTGKSLKQYYHIRLHVCFWLKVGINYMVILEMKEETLWQLKHDLGQKVKVKA